MERLYRGPNRFDESVWSSSACLTPAFVPEEVVAETSFKAHPDRFIRMTSAFTRHTKTEKDVSPTEVAQIYKEQFDQGAKGVGETGYMLGVRGDYTVKDLKPVIDVILQYDVPVLTHTGWGVSGQRVGQNYIGAERWAENFGLLLSTYPDLKVVLGPHGRSPCNSRRIRGSPPGIFVRQCLLRNVKISSCSCD